VKPLYGHIAREDVRAEFWLNFLNILYVEYVFQNNENICSQEPKHHPIPCHDLS
jgi:hypothetical protein